MPYDSCFSFSLSRYLLVFITHFVGFSSIFSITRLYEFFFVRMRNEKLKNFRKYSLQTPMEFNGCYLVLKQKRGKTECEWRKQREGNANSLYVCDHDLAQFDDSIQWSWLHLCVISLLILFYFCFVQYANSQMCAVHLHLCFSVNQVRRIQYANICNITTFSSSFQFTAVLSQSKLNKKINKFMHF